MNRKTFLIFILMIFLVNVGSPAISFASRNEAKKYYLWGIRSLKKREFKKATGYFSKAIDKYPEYKEAWYEMGNAQYAMEKYDKAIDNYYVALEIDPNYKKAMKKIGSCFLKQKNYQMAVFKMEKAKEYYPNDADMYFLLGQAYEGANKKRLAVLSYNKANKLKPEKYGFLRGRIRLIKDNISVDEKIDAPSPTPMVTGAPQPEVVPDPDSTVPSTPEKPVDTFTPMDPDHINVTTTTVLENLTPSPEESLEQTPEKSPGETDTGSTDLVRGTDIKPEDLGNNYDENVTDKRKKIMGILINGSLLILILLSMAGGLHLLREYMKSKERGDVLGRLETGKTSTHSDDDNETLETEESGKSNLFEEKWKKHPDKDDAGGEPEDEKPGGAELSSESEPDKETSFDNKEEDELLSKIISPAETKEEERDESEKKLDKDEKPGVSPEIDIDVPDFLMEDLTNNKIKDKDTTKPGESSEAFEEPGKAYYREVIYGERDRRRDVSKKLLEEMRDRLRIDELQGKPGESENLEEQVKDDKEDLKEAKTTGEVTPVSVRSKKKRKIKKKEKTKSKFSENKSPKEEKKTEETKEETKKEPGNENSESVPKLRPLPDAGKLKKRVDPFVCVCGKIIRDGAYICPRCGRGTR